MDHSILLLFLFAFTIHNLEEAAWLIRQSSRVSKTKLHKTITQDQFMFGLFWVTGLAYLITALYMFYPTQELLKYAYFGYVGCMLLNIVFPHLLVTIIERCYSPGLLTGILVILPIHTLIVKTGIDSSIITMPQFMISTLAMAVVLVATIPLSFMAGKKLINY